MCKDSGDSENNPFYLCDNCGNGTHHSCLHKDNDMRTDLVFWYCSYCVSNLDKDDPA